MQGKGFANKNLHSVVSSSAWQMRAISLSTGVAIS